MILSLNLELTGLGSYLVSTSTPGAACCWHLFLCSGDLNSGPHAYVTSTLLTELLPKPCVFDINVFLQHENYFHIIFLVVFILILFLIKETQKKEQRSFTYEWVKPVPNLLFISIVKTLIYILCVSVSCLHVYLCTSCLWRPEEGMRASGTIVPDFCVSLYRCCEPNLGPLEE